MLRIGQIEATATADKKYTDGSVAGGVAATRLRAAAFNAMQEELAHIVEEAGLVLDVNDMTQVLAALQKMFAGNSKSLGALAALTGAANKLPYFTGPEAAALTALTDVGRDLIGKSTVADVLGYLGIGNGGRLLNVQTYAITVPYVKTPGTRFIVVKLIAGGGASGGLVATTSGQNSVSCPGAAGCWAMALFTSGFDGVTITIGSGGTTSVGTGANGGASSFGTLLNCPGGPGSPYGSALTPPSYTSAGAGASAPTIDTTHGYLIESEYGQQIPPAIVVSPGVATNYISTDRTKMGNPGTGGQGQLNGASSSQKTGFPGFNGSCEVWEFS